MKRCALLVIGILLLGIMSCTQNEQGEDGPATADQAQTREPVVLEMMVFANEGMMKNYETVIGRFNKSHEHIKVEIKNVFGEDWTDYEQTMRSYLLSGKSPDIVDISVIYRNSMIEEGLLMDLMPFARESGFDFDLYFQNQFEGLLKEGALYGIPSGALLMGVFINKDLFQEAGVEIPSPNWNDTWTWEEFAEAARTIRALSTEDEQVYGMTTSFTIGWILPFLMSSGADFLSVQGAPCDAEDTRILNTLDFLQGLMFEEGVSPSVMELLTLQPYQYFINGELGMTVDGNWWMEAFRDSADFEWGVVPMPIGEVPVTGMYVDCWAVPAASDHGREAFTVLQFFLEEEQQKSGIMKGIPVLKTSAYEIYRNRFPGLSEEEIDVWFEGIRYGRVPAYFTGWSEFQNETQEVFRRFGLGELTSQETAQQLCESYMKQNTEQAE